MGLTFVDQVKGGNIPKEFHSFGSEGLQSAGIWPTVLAGYPMDSMKITLLDGSFHRWTRPVVVRNRCPQRLPCSRSPRPFGDSGARDVRGGRYPEENIGDIIGDLNKRRGQITGMESKVPPAW